MSRPHGFQVRQICQKRPTQEIYVNRDLRKRSTQYLIDSSTQCLDPMDLRYDKYIKRDLRKRPTEYRDKLSRDIFVVPEVHGVFNLGEVARSFFLGDRP